MSYDNGKVTKPIGIPDIQKAVGYSSGDIGTLIDNGRINVYNIHKPVRNAKKNDLTDAEFKSDDVCLGFDKEKLIGQNISAIFEYAKENRTWEKIYLRPRGVVYNDLGQISIQEFQRFNDFNNYDKNAVRPYTYNFPDAIVTYRPVAELKSTMQSFNFTINSASETPITAFGVLTSQAFGYATSLDQYRYVIVYRKKVGGGWSDFQLAYGNTLSVDNASNQTIGITFSDGTGDYELCVMATRETATKGEDLQQLATAWLDYGFHSLNISAQRIPIEVSILDFSNIRAEKRTNDMGKTVIALLGFTDYHFVDLEASLPNETATVVDTIGGLTIHVSGINADGAIVAETDIDMIGESFSYEGTGKKTISFDIPNDPILDGVFTEEINRIKYLTIKVTPYTNMTDDNNGQFRWTNGAASQEYRVDFMH